MKILALQQASRKLSIAEVRALNETPIVLAPAQPGFIYYPIIGILRKSAGGNFSEGAIGCGSNTAEGNAAILFGLTITGGNGPTTEVQSTPGAGFMGGDASSVGDPGDESRPGFVGIPDVPLVLSAFGADLDAANFTLDVDVWFFAIPSE